MRLTILFSSTLLVCFHTREDFFHPLLRSLYLRFELSPEIVRFFLSLF